jgi:hypothetical protein
MSPNKGYCNDIWALDLNCCTLPLAFLSHFDQTFQTVKSNPFWESYEPALGNEKPLPRACHVSVTTGDHIIMFVSLLTSPSPLIIMFCRFGGWGRPHIFNDTWSFNILTRKWTELQCTGSIPSPRKSHAAVLIDDVMYVYGGRAVGRTNLSDLTAFNLSSKQFSMFNFMRSFTYDIQLSDGSRFKT